MNRRCITLVDLLRDGAQLCPERIAFRFLLDGETEQEVVTFGELEVRAQATAAVLQDCCAPGSRVLLLFPSGIDYICSFLGCWYAGVIPIPCPPLVDERYRERVLSIASDCQPSVALAKAGSCSGQDASGRNASVELPGLKWLNSGEIDREMSRCWRSLEILPESIALLQYTSGSTARPKGVMVTHDNLLQNEKMIQSAFRQTSESRILGWLPLYHDMGLIGNVLQPLFLRATGVLMSPARFLQHPGRWLRAISVYRATTSGGPDFGYRHCLRHCRSEDLESLDLRSWGVAFNGSEPVRAETINEFSDRFANSGFRREAFQPCYGLAESTLFVSGRKDSRPPNSIRLSSDALKHNRVDEVSEDSESQNVSVILSCGSPSHEQDIAIVNPDTCRRCGSREIGEIWVTGSHVALGYWSREELTNTTFRSAIVDVPGKDYLRTGDIGFISNGELYVVGRIKEVIILRGEKHYPEDIERSVSATLEESAKRPIVAFSFETEQGECAVIIQETSLRDGDSLARSAEAVREIVLRRHGLDLHAVAYVKNGGIPKTSSGKKQRALCRKLFLEATLSLVKVVRFPGSEFHPSVETDPSSAVLGILQKIWEELLGRNVSSRRDNFFELGGTSLLAARLALKVQRQLHISLSLETIFRCPTLDAMARAVEQSNQGPGPKIHRMRRVNQKLLAEVNDMNEEELDIYLKCFDNCE
jgi:acyl-CoA synthetase (AMP-forming)/AMP-acid ligase II